eukprot:1386290-Amorphochlora_amoeboformis.AAC.2
MNVTLSLRIAQIRLNRGTTPAHRPSTGFRRRVEVVHFTHLRAAYLFSGRKITYPRHKTYSVIHAYLFLLGNSQTWAVVC